ncbi:MAG: hypothetical protein J6570_07665 [Snodgrassella sp.]|nr:hypothetical protein [Snodgrassella sp.]
MGFGDFLLKAASFVGKASVSIASEIISTGPLHVNKQYLNKVLEINDLGLDYKQKKMILEAKKLNDRALSLKNSERDRLRRIKEIQKDQDSSSSNKLELDRLMQDSVRYAQEYDETYSYLKPLLDEINSFVQPLMDERRERRL